MESTPPPQNPHQKNPLRKASIGLFGGQGAGFAVPNVDFTGGCFPFDPTPSTHNPPLGYLSTFRMTCAQAFKKTVRLPLQRPAKEVLKIAFGAIIIAGDTCMGQ